MLLERLGAAPTVYLVGGAVRDLLLGLRAPDLDLVAEGDALALARRLDSGAVLHERFGTATFTADGFTFDIARARRETYPRPGALPEVEPADIKTDLGRRDFTVNALAMPIAGVQAGSIIAAPNALEDLDRAQLRVLHDGSFTDDPTRLFRLARYAGRLGFSVEPHTAKLAGEARDAGAIGTVTGPRIGHELRLLACEDDPVSAFVELRRLELDAAVHPGFELADPDRARGALALLPPDGRRDLTTLALASERVEELELRRLLDGLGFESSDRAVIVSAATRGHELARALAEAPGPSGIAEAASGAPPELIAIAGSLGPSEQAGSWLAGLRHVGLEIDGADLLAAGVPEGPPIGRALRAALAARLDGLAMDREAQLAHALRAAAGSE